MGALLRFLFSLFLFYWAFYWAARLLRCLFRRRPPERGAARPGSHPENPLNGEEIEDAEWEEIDK